MEEQHLEFFIELERLVWDALTVGDAAADEALLTADFVGVYPTGFADRADHVGQLVGGPTVDSYVINEARLVRISSTAVLLCYRAEFRRPDSGVKPVIRDAHIIEGVRVVELHTQLR